MLLKIGISSDQQMIMWAVVPDHENFLEVRYIYELFMLKVSSSGLTAFYGKMRWKWDWGFVRKFRTYFTYQCLHNMHLFSRMTDFPHKTVATEHKIILAWKLYKKFIKIWRRRELAYILPNYYDLKVMPPC